MKRFRTLKMLFVLISVLAMNTPASADFHGTAGPHITDAAGDANAVMTPVWTGGMIGYLLEELVGNGDPLGGGTATEPASYAEADVRAVGFETTYREVPVGADGIDYLGSGLKIHIETSAAPSGQVPLRFALKTFLLPTDGEECRSEFEGFIGDQPNPYPRRTGLLRWNPSGDWGSVCPSPREDYTDPAWSATVTQSPPGMVLSIPFDSLTETERSLLGEGVVIDRPRVFSATYSFGGWIDSSPVGASFVIGEDLPNDVPCTSSCPP